MAKNKLATKGREFSFPDLLLQINELIGKNSRPKQPLNLNKCCRPIYTLSVSTSSNLL